MPMSISQNESHLIIFLCSQEAFMENYFASQRDNIFRNVEVLIYVFDVESRELEKVLDFLTALMLNCLNAIILSTPVKIYEV